MTSGTEVSLLKDMVSTEIYPEIDVVRQLITTLRKNVCLRSKDQYEIAWQMAKIVGLR